MSDHSQFCNAVQAYELDLDDRSARIVGTEIAYDAKHDVTVYLTEDERVVIYDGAKLRCHVIAGAEDPGDTLRIWLDEDTFVEACHALGIKPTVEL